jgi:anti-sigma B factor antagonist
MEVGNTIQSRQQDGILVCSLSGRLDAVSANGTSSELLELIGGNVVKVLLNLEKLEYVSSLGLRVFVQAAKQLGGKGGTLKLCSATAPVRKVLEISALDTLLDLRDNEADALQSF